MTLEQEITDARKDVVTDGYEMSVGEVVSLYRDGELKVDPEFQRYFRWDHGRKTRFIESILLSIPVPPIFVFQVKDGSWELVDGLQRLSTILQFMGVLKGPDGETKAPFKLGATRMLPSLADHAWEESPGSIQLKSAHKLDIKRARLRVEILKRESDPTSKYELFQRLNTGGASLSAQEVRNCTMVMMNPPFYRWMRKLATIGPFVDSIALSESQLQQQYDLELALRFLAMRDQAYKPSLDVHQYLDDASIRMAESADYDQKKEGRIFRDTFRIIRESIGDSHDCAFRRWDGTKFSGKFLISVFEVLSLGISHNLEPIKAMRPAERSKFIEGRARSLWSNTTFKKNSGAGVRGTSRLGNLLPLAPKFMKP